MELKLPSIWSLTLFVICMGCIILWSWNSPRVDFSIEVFFDDAISSSPLSAWTIPQIRWNNSFHALHGSPDLWHVLQHCPLLPVPVRSGRRGDAPDFVHVLLHQLELCHLDLCVRENPVLPERVWPQPGHREQSIKGLGLVWGAASRLHGKSTVPG